MPKFEVLQKNSSIINYHAIRHYFNKEIIKQNDSATDVEHLWSMVFG